MSILPTDTTSEGQAQLEAALKAFTSRETIVVAAESPLPGITQERIRQLQEEQPLDEASESPETQAVQEEQTVSEESEEVSPEFSLAFESYFGMKPSEAREVVNQLVVLRDEYTLMNTWGVAPVEYKQRIEQVKAFYDTLPDEGKEQFNSVDGAITIWEHLQNTATGTAPRSTTRPSAVKTKSKPQSKPNVIRKADILRMSNEEYTKNLPMITKAFREGRVVE